MLTSGRVCHSHRTRHSHHVLQAQGGRSQAAGGRGLWGLACRLSLLQADAARTHSVSIRWSVGHSQTWPVPNLHTGSGHGGCPASPGRAERQGAGAGQPPHRRLRDLGQEPPEPPRRLRRLQHTFSLSRRDSPELVDVDRGDGSGGCCPRTRRPALVALREASGASTHRASAVCRAGVNSVKFYARLPGAA